MQNEQKGFKGIRENLLNLVKDIDSGSGIFNTTSNQSYERVTSFKIHLRKTTKWDLLNIQYHKFNQV